MHFHVGDKAEAFGEGPERVSGPRYAESYLPIVRIAYKQAETTYDLSGRSGPFTLRFPVQRRESKAK
jgi:hypothetical protein